MATRLYLPSVTVSTPISPATDAAWQDTSALARLMTSTVRINDAMATVVFVDTDQTNKNILFRQFISVALTAGQTITGSQALKAQIRVSETNTLHNLFLTIGIRVITSDGVVQKTVLPVTRDDVEAATSLTNRQYTGTSIAGDYTTVTGDRLVIEMGMGGDPTGTVHNSSMRFGDADGAADLAEDDTTTTDNWPWVQLTDTLTFVSATQEGATMSAMGV